MGGEPDNVWYNQNQKPLFELAFYRVNRFQRSANVTLEKDTYYSLWPLETSWPRMNVESWLYSTLA